MGTKLQNAVDALQRVARDYQSVIDLAAELGRIGNIEVAEAETNRRLAQTRADLSTAQKALSALQEDVLGAQARARELLKKTDEDVNALMQRAHDDAIAVANKAAEEAQAKLKATADESQKIIEDARTEARTIVDNAGKAKAVIESQAKKADTRLAKLNDDIAEKTAALQLLEKRLSEIKEGVGHL